VVDPLQPGDPRQVGPFRLLGRLGAGGMGRVFLGTSLGGRKVAVKIVHPHYADDPEFRRRFAREVATARQVGGFHTAAVVGADPDANPPWMATAYIAGPSLADAIAQRGPLDEAGVRQLGAALAEGLTAIHDCGLIHRDLKPGNVILADDGPRIIDFGIAKGADTTALTQSSAVIGTLRYMSPEQLNGQDLTPQSDVFALGTVLAYAATGHDPFAGPTMPAVITRILTGLPDLAPLTGDLRGIIADCLAKDPSHRPSPGDLPALFNRPAGPDPTVVATPAPVPAANPLPAPEPVPTAVPPPEPRPTAASGPERPPVPEPSLDSTVNVGLMGWQQPGEPRAAKAPSRAPQPRRHQRTGLIAAGVAVVVALAVVSAVELNNHPASTPSAADTHSVTPSGSGTHPVSPSATGKPPAGVMTATGIMTAALKDPKGGGVGSVAFGPDGVLATGITNGSTYLWNTTTDKIISTLTAPQSGPVNSLAFGSNDTLATGGYGGSTYLWNTGTGKITATVTDPLSEGLYSVALGPNGILATGDYNSRIWLWNDSGKNVAVLQDPASVLSMAFGPGGILATGDTNGKIYLWNTTTDKITATLTDPTGNSIYSVAFGPGGILATGDHGGSTYLWNIETDKITATLTNPTRNYNVTDPASRVVFSVAFGPEDTLVAGSNLGSTYVWNIKTDEIIATLTDPGSIGVYSVAVGPDDTVATGDYNGNTYLWRVTYHES
jgi:serine/threonine protein kinase